MGKVDDVSLMVDVQSFKLKEIIGITDTKVLLELKPLTSTLIGCMPFPITIELHWLWWWFRKNIIGHPFFSTCFGDEVCTWKKKGLVEDACFLGTASLLYRDSYLIDFLSRYLSDTMQYFSYFF